MDKEALVHIHNGILVTYKKEHIWVSSNEVDEPRSYYTEWSTSKRERQTSYINTDTWNLKGQHRQSYMWGNKGDTDILDMVWEADSGMI